MIHAWEKYGYAAAQAEHFNKYNCKRRNPEDNSPEFKRIVRGKIEFLRMIRGESPIYLAFQKKLQELDPLPSKEMLSQLSQKPARNHKIVIFTEGKSDWKHLKKAKQALGIDFDVSFYEYTRDMGDGELLKECELASKGINDNLRIYVFDRDKPDTINQVTTDGQDYKSWGNKVYSLAIPVPDHRKQHKGVSIEFYYSDAEIITPDDQGRRLYMSHEFDPITGIHRDENPSVICLNPNRLQNADTAETCKIIDSRVVLIKPPNDSVALAKERFARYILNDNPPFAAFNFASFKKIFDLLLIIMDEEENPS